MNRILEINRDISGRRKIKIVLHEIYPDETHWNINGITYLEQYTRDNADTVKGMPLCAEFLDDSKEVPYGHGLTGTLNGMPVFEDSVQVGTFEDWSIEDIEIDGVVHKCLCGVGYINESRYPKFCDWIDRQVAEGNKVFGSVEFVGTPENDWEILYRDGWKQTGRIPTVYDYSGFCILTIAPADNTAMLLEFDRANQEKIETSENEFDCIFGGVMNAAQKDTEYDSVFLDLLGERNTADESEFDNIFGDELKAEKQIKTEFDDIFGKFESHNQKEREFDKIFQ